MSVLKINKDHFNAWVKNPKNIFAGSSFTYSNVFSQFEHDTTKIIESNILNNFFNLPGKTIGYMTEEQRIFAEVLHRMGSEKCFKMITHHLETYIQPKVTFENTSNRMCLARLINNHLSEFDKLPAGKQCLTTTSLLKKIDMTKQLGKGSFGNVYLATVDKTHRIALKMAVEGMTSSAIGHPYDPKFEAWNEINIIKPYINSLIEKGICQNFPYVYNTFICKDECDFEREIKGKLIVKKQSCYLITVELGSGHLGEWIKTPRTAQEKYNSLFQCMAGLHTLQKYFQICNNDVKALNILYKEVPIVQNSYWEYVILGKSYYIPNTGSVFFINDFGVSRCFDPSLPICLKKKKGKGTVYHNIRDVGYRPFIVVDNKLTIVNYTTVINGGDPLLRLTAVNKGLVKIPRMFLTGTLSAILTPEQKHVMKNGNPNHDTFYSDNDILPFYDGYVDIQDMLRTFVGGERVTQPGMHQDIAVIAPELLGVLSKYLLTRRGISCLANMADLSPSTFLAGYFIDNFFSKDLNMFITKPKNGILIQKFVI